MRREAAPGAFGARASGSREVEPATPPRRRKTTPSDQRRAEARQRRGLEQAVQDRHDIRNERDPLARRHLPQGERHIAPDELPGRDWTRASRVESVTVDVEHAYAVKRGGK